MRAFLDGLTTFEYAMIAAILVTSAISNVLKSIRTHLKTKKLKLETAALEAANRKFRGQQALEHRRRGFPGDEAAARTHELEIESIREGRVGGSSRIVDFCPQCLKKGDHLFLLEIEDKMRCGTCRFEREKR